MSASFYDLMKYAKLGIASPDMTMYDRLKASALFGGTAPDKTITGIPPLTLTAKKEGAASAYKLMGKIVQNGTPTPDNPVMPEFVGVRTGNLLLPKTNHTETFFDVIIEIDGAQNIKISGTASNSGGRTIKLSDTFMLPAGTYTFGLSQTINGLTAYLNDSSNTAIVGTSLTRSFTISEDTEVYFGLNVVSGKTYNSTFNIQLYEGSTPEPYEPHGYKIPITSNGAQAATIYLDKPLYGTGDVLDEYDSTGKIVRKWGVKVFDGTENWNAHLERSGSFYRNMGIELPNNYVAFCTHGITVNTSSGYTYGKVLVERSGNTSYFNFWFLTDTTDVKDFKAYLIQQYAAGTPVTVIYQLATPTEETITAPLLTLTKGVNVIDVDTSVTPSSMSITGQIK